MWRWLEILWLQFSSAMKVRLQFLVLYLYNETDVGLISAAYTYLQRAVDLARFIRTHHTGWDQPDRLTLGSC